MRLEFDILTLFPGMFHGPLQESIVKRAAEAGIIAARVHNIRDWAAGKHHQTDDTPYGGGGGMVMKPDPIWNAAEAVLGADMDARGKDVSVVLLTPQGRLLTHAVARELARNRRVVLICGRYEGVDERVRELLVTDEISIGDYVLSGGELPAMVVVEAVTRLLPGVLGDPGATFEDSHAEGLLEYPQYTRPPEFRGLKVPDELLSGNHAELVKWRRQQSLMRTFQRRPDLLQSAALTSADRAFLRSLGWTGGEEDADSLSRER
jgi:tRNA (guanine37-N1)-methyltransferase